MQSTLNLKSLICAVVLIPLISCGLTGCATVSRDPKESLQIYQTETLALKSGFPIQTRNGMYTPQTDEIWYSAAEYKRLERQVLDLSTALSHIKNSQ